MKYINENILKDIEKFKNEFSNGKPFEHVYIENFLNKEYAEKLLSVLKKEEFEEKESDLFHFHQTKDFFNLKKGLLREFYDYVGSSEFIEVIERISGIKLKTEKIDMAGSLYKNMNFLLCHDDELAGRKIAFLFYLSREFEEKDGGGFVLFDSLNGKPGKEYKKYPVKWNSFLIFKVSEKSFHEVEEVIGNKERYAIGGWFH